MGGAAAWGVGGTTGPFSLGRGAGVKLWVPAPTASLHSTQDSELRPGKPPPRQLTSCTPPRLSKFTSAQEALKELSGRGSVLFFLANRTADGCAQPRPSRLRVHLLCSKLRRIRVRQTQCRGCAFASGLC